MDDAETEGDAVDVAEMMDFAFRYVDLALGDVSRRNNVVTLEEIPAALERGGFRNSFRTVHRFPINYLAHFYQQAETHVSGKPTVAGYCGPSLLESVPLDFDGDGDLEAVLAMARRLVAHLDADHGLKVEFIGLYFSGKKGLHLELPGRALGLDTPGTDLGQRAKRGVVALCEVVGVPTSGGDGAGVDLSIYDKNRLWRLPDTRHAGSGLYKVGLTVDEFLAATGGEIRALARSPRPEVRPIPWRDQAAIATLAELFAAPPGEGASEGDSKEAKSEGEPSQPRTDGPASNGEQGRLRPLFDAIRTKGVDAGTGGLRHAAALLVGYFLREDGWPFETAFEMARTINNTRFRPAIDDAELKRQIADAFACGWLVSAEALAALKAALMPEPAKPKEPVLELISVDDEPAWAALPEEKFYIPDLVPARHIIFVVAEPKAGKSLLTLDMGWHIALDLGHAWPHGRPPSETTTIPLETGARVLYIACEDARSTVKKRREQFREAYGPTGDRLVIAFTRTRPLRLWHADDIEELARYVEVDGFNVIVIDTLGAAAAGRGDKDRDEWAEEVEPSLRILRDKGATPVLVEHMRKETGAESRAKKPKLRRPDPHALFGSVAKRALYGSGLYFGETPWPRRFSLFVESKVSDAAPWFIVERAPMNESPGWRHRYVEEVATAQASLATKSKEEGERTYQAVLSAFGDERLSYDELGARAGCSRSTAQKYVEKAMAGGLAVEAGKKGRALAFRAPKPRTAERSAETSAAASAVGPQLHLVQEDEVPRRE